MMKKSLRQMLLVSLSASLLVSVAPLAYAEEASSEEETSEVVEESVAEESTEEVADIEKSEVQNGLEEAVRMLETEYPDAKIEEIDVEYDRDEQRYDITVNAFDAEEDIELEVVWKDGEVTESEFNGGLFDSLDVDNATEESTEEVADEDMMDDDDSVEADIVENESEAELSDDSVVEDASDDEAVNSEEAPTQEERPSLDMDSVITIDEATELALGEVGNGEAINWNLKADASDFWDFLQAEEDQEQGPIWTVEVDESESMMSKEVTIDALAGTVIDSPEQEESEESVESEESSVE